MGCLNLPYLNLCPLSFLSSSLNWERGRVSWKVGSLLGRLSGQLPVCHITYPITWWKEKTCKKIRDENRKIKWVEGERSEKAEATKGRGSFGTELRKGASTLSQVAAPLSLSGFSLWPDAILRIARTFPRCLGYWVIGKCNFSQALPSRTPAWGDITKIPCSPPLFYEYLFSWSD